MAAQRAVGLFWVCTISFLITMAFIYFQYEDKLFAINKNFLPKQNQPKVTERTHTPTMPVPPMEYEYVIAHYKENLDWLKPIANYCHVYDKGHEPGLKPSFRVKNWEELSNVGREAHTYLYHIIKNYENLANITVFLQGTLSNHAPSCFRTPHEFVEKAKKGVFCIRFGTETHWGRLTHISKWKTEYDRGLMRHAKSTMGDFYQDVFGMAPPKSGVGSCRAGCFSATRRCLQTHPKALYQKMISYVDDHVNPEEGHYMERLWLGMATC